MASRINFTKRVLSNIAPAAPGKRAYVYDLKVNGLLLSITPAGTKSFIVYRKVHGRPVRVTLGRYPDMTIEQARKKALETLSKIAGGINPNANKRQLAASNVTLREVFEEYLQVRKNLKAGTILDYRKAMRQTFSDWMEKPLHSITKDKVKKKHTKRGKESPARANNAFRVLRALFNFAKHHYEAADGCSLFLINPVECLSATKAWYKIQRKQSYIKRSDLPAWFKVVINLKSEYSSSKAEIISDYLLFLLLTGTRRQEAAQLTWSDVSLIEGAFRLTDTKNRETVELPISSFLCDLLKKRHHAADSQFVFPGSGKTGHLVAPRKQLLRVRQLSGIEFSLHDLRRTFATIGESLDISRYTLKRLLNHKTHEDIDVTAGYIIPSLERLHVATNKITKYVLDVVGFEYEK